MAQPTVNIDWLPRIGDRLSNVSVIVDSLVDPGPAGGNIDYDFSGLLVPDTPFVAFLDVVDPASTPYAAQFTEADICLTANLLGVDIYSYAAINNDCIENIGSVAF